MTTYTGVTNFQKQSGFLAHPVYFNNRLLMQAAALKGKNNYSGDYHIYAHKTSKMLSMVSLPNLLFCLSKFRYIILV